MALKISNTLTRSKEKFIPIDEKNIRMYVCGPTVYDYPHVGNARPLIVFDLLFRLLSKIYPNSKVTYVRNITDIDDKIIEASNKSKISIQDLTSKVTKDFHDDCNYLGCLNPTIEPKATEHLNEMINLIKKLFQNDFSKDLYLSVFKGIKYLTRLEFDRKKKILKKEVDWVVLLSLLLIDQTKNFERFVKDFSLSNEVKKRLNNLQSQFTFKTTDSIEKLDSLKKKVLEYGVSSVADFVHFQYLVNEKYEQELYENNLKIIKETEPPIFNFDTNILFQKGFKEGEKLGNALNFLKKRWLATSYEIREKDIDDATKLFK